MNSAFLDEVWTHVTTSLYAIEYWAYVDICGDDGNIIEVREHNLDSDGEPGEPYLLNRNDLEKDLRKMFDLSAQNYRNGATEPYYWPASFIAGVVKQDITEWDDEIVDIFVQLSTLGEITYG